MKEVEARKVCEPCKGAVSASMTRPNRLGSVAGYLGRPRLDPVPCDGDEAADDGGDVCAWFPIGRGEDDNAQTSWPTAAIAPLTPKDMRQTTGKGVPVTWLGAEMRLQKKKTIMIPTSIAPSTIAGERPRAKRLPHVT